MKAGVRAFWEWFETIAADLGHDLGCEAILAELDRRVSALGDLSWEVGPGIEEENALVITPDGSRGRLDRTRQVVAGAPRIPGWEFHWARPQREWNLQFTVELDAGGALHVDAREWRYVLFRYPDNTFDVVLEQNNLDDVTENDRYRCAVVLLDGILGEFKRIELVRDVEPVVKLPEGQASKANPIEVLADHLGSLQASDR